MNDIVWINQNTPTQIEITENGVSWNHKNKCMVFSWNHVIGSKIGLSENYLTLLIFNKSRDKFKVYRFRHKSAKAAATLVDKINGSIQCFNRNYAVFLNPISGNRKGVKIYNNFILNIIEYSNSKHQLFEVQYSNYFEQLSFQDFSEFTDIICIGGDGTMQLLVTALRKQNMLMKYNLIIIPAGSQNSLACELYNKSLNNALLSIAKGKPTTCDLLKVTLKEKELIATTAVAWGLVSDIAEDAQQYRIFGRFRYKIISLMHFFQEWKSYNCKIFNDNFTKEGNFLSIIIANHSVKNFDGDEVVCPRACINDGHLDIQTLDFVGRLSTVKIIRKMQNGGIHILSKKVHDRKDTIVTIIPRNHFVFNIDGEIHYSKIAIVESLPASIRYLVIKF